MIGHPGTRYARSRTVAARARTAEREAMRLRLGDAVALLVAVVMAANILLLHGVGEPLSDRHPPSLSLYGGGSL